MIQRTKELEVNLRSTRDEKEKMYLDHVRSQGEDFEKFTAKLSVVFFCIFQLSSANQNTAGVYKVKEEQLNERTELRQAKLQVEELSQRSSTFQDEIMSLKIEVKTLTESKKRLEAELSSKNISLAERERNAKLLQEENEKIVRRLQVLSQELSVSTGRIKEFEHQTYNLDLDKVTINMYDALTRVIF